MDIEKTILPPEAYQEICLMKRRIEFLETCFTMEFVENPDLAMHLKEMYSDVDTDLETFCAKLARIQTGAEA
jgi:hypothetical protein